MIVARDESDFGIPDFRLSAFLDPFTLLLQGSIKCLSVFLVDVASDGPFYRDLRLQHI